jgi:hypothetical protein
LLTKIIEKQTQPFSKTLNILKEELKQKIDFFSYRSKITGNMKIFLFESEL